MEIAGMYFIVDLGKQQSEITIQDNEAKTVGYAATRQKTEAFRSNLATAKYILDKQVPYTNLIFSLAKGLPSGAVINTLSIDPVTFGTPTTLIVNTTSYQKAIDVKNSLQNAKVNDKTPLFSSVSFQSVTVSDSTSSYPYTATYNITYSKAALAR